MAACVLLLNLLGWGLLVRLVAPQRYDIGSSGVFGVGLGVTAAGMSLFAVALIIGLFVVTWLVASAGWRIGRFEQRWCA
ncbi:hypothetical protein SK803_31850 [Lentzea sp. BCCO 10_0856]|uniref:Uncharacterized protein n=1 Tax=Lentzea miocenica TaxID=3095431 RepID=A0ABU4T9K6_9PSEU|nr:hypothetical protein [Lentzea sp. BCCO 10_0856]MDX8034834.1 hypothetical protein [Lentzea sp. BCCO 10_0856]